jgi:CUE domain
LAKEGRVPLIDLTLALEQLTSRRGTKRKTLMFVLRMQRLRVPNVPKGNNEDKPWRCWRRCFLVCSSFYLSYALDLDREVVEAVIIAKEGRVGVCIDVCLELSGGIETSSDPNRITPSRSQETKGMDMKPSEEEQAEGSTDSSDLLGLDGEGGISSLKLEVDGQHEKPSTQVELMD